MTFGAAPALGLPSSEKRSASLLDNLLHRQRLDSGRGQLDGQWQSVERAAQVADGVDLSARRRRDRPLGRGSTSEQRDGVGERQEVRARRRTSPSMSSGTWLVHRIRRPGTASSRRTARAAAASRTCSQLSRMTNAESPLLSRSNRRRLAAGNVQCRDQRCRRRRRPSPLSRVEPARSPPVARFRPARSALRPTATATAVLPTPPGPNDLHEPLSG